MVDFLRFNGELGLGTDPKTMSVSEIRSGVGCGKSNWSKEVGIWSIETVSVESAEGKTRGCWKEEFEKE